MGNQQSFYSLDFKSGEELSGSSDAAHALELPVYGLANVGAKNEVPKQ